MELIRTEQYDYVNAKDYPNVPELAKPTPPHTIWVGWGRFGAGTRANTFASEAFWDCTGFIFADKDSASFGLFHSFSDRRLGPEMADKMAAFAKGTVLPVEGSVCIENVRMKKDLQDMLDITVLDPLQFDVFTDYREAHPFQLVYRPSVREILVARNAKKDLLVFRGL